MRTKPYRKIDRSQLPPEDPHAGLPDGAVTWWPSYACRRQRKPRLPPPELGNKCLHCGKSTENMERWVVRIHEGRPPRTPYRWRPIGYACCEDHHDLAYAKLETKGGAQ